MKWEKGVRNYTEQSNKILIMFRNKTNIYLFMCNDINKFRNTYSYLMLLMRIIIIIIKTLSFFFTNFVNLCACTWLEIHDVFIRKACWFRNNARNSQQWVRFLYLWKLPRVVLKMFLGRNSWPNICLLTVLSTKRNLSNLPYFAICLYEAPPDSITFSFIVLFLTSNYSLFLLTIIIKSNF